MTRYLGIDFGGRRIGLAISDSAAAIASPLATIAATGDVNADARAVLDRATGYDIDAFVVGLPLNMDDSEGPQAKLARQFGEVLARQSNLPVYYYDERLSTRAAEELLRPADLTRGKKKERLDRVAAAVMLQEFLDAREKE